MSELFPFPPENPSAKKLQNYIEEIKKSISFERILLYVEDLEELNLGRIKAYKKTIQEELEKISCFEESIEGCPSMETLYGNDPTRIGTIQILKAQIKICSIIEESKEQNSPPDTECGVQKEKRKKPRYRNAHPKIRGRKNRQPAFT